MFESMRIEAEVLELDIIPDGYAIQKELKMMTGQRTVPNVFVGGKHVGGNDDVQAAARSGELQKMLN
jgi:glutaredoxin 3